MKMILGTYNKSVVESSFLLPPLVVMQQSYYFLSTVKTIAVTTTARGITAKQLLIATVSDQILSLDKRYFDPRRPLIPTAADREEGLMPYTDTLPIPPQSHLTHGYQVMGIREIVTLPTRLESTCLVFAHGIDLFFMRTAPSKMYDTLSEDFSYALLVITIVVLLIAILVTGLLSRSQELNNKWR
ncbi:hypothetical protein CBR_g46226 [Chara braunii]|uniref:ER membrane protein complex subunit 1 n=1 Tax=Chara braunii TaxID=69332 RepID=A0A388K3P2_CHABU|nr:hypothetical protein CBR_g46226 [Chara braunii]|eukprot:GBG64684.1 hypothetical protein CBR_g46226 [Chara braunii]